MKKISDPGLQKGLNSTGGSYFQIQKLYYSSSIEIKVYLFSS